MSALFTAVLARCPEFFLAPIEPVLDADLFLLANIVEATTTGGGLVATPCGAPVFDRCS